MRVFIVDSSASVRMLMRRCLGGLSGLQVLGAAASGDDAARLQAEAVVWDLEPDGPASLDAWRVVRTALPRAHHFLVARSAVETRAMLGRLAERVVVLERPALGETWRDWFDRVLLPSFGLAEAAPRLVSALARPGWGPAGPQQIRAIVLGASTGGPDAIRTVLAALPPSVGVPVLITQHMPANFTRYFAESLDARLPWRVAEAHEGVVPGPGEVWIAKGEMHLRVRLGPTGPTLALDNGPAEHSCRPAVDPLFRSAAEVYRGAVLGVVLTGMGSDGALGAKALRETGAPVIIQDQETSVVWGMPGAVAAAGAASEILPLPEVAGAIARIVRGL